MWYRICKLFLLLLLAGACKTVYQKPDNAFPRIELGEGGGFTGAFNSYIILQNGQVFYKNNFADTGVSFGNISKKHARQYLKEARNLVAIPTPIKEPDNIYRVLSYSNADTIYEATWYEKRPYLDSFYNKVLADIQKSNEKKR